MLDRLTRFTGIAVVIALLAPGAALANVKCQCNNGTVVIAMGADYEDEDVEESCNDACSGMGGGRVWSADRDEDEGGGGSSGDSLRRDELPRTRPSRGR